MTLFGAQLYQQQVEKHRLKSVGLQKSFDSLGLVVLKLEKDVTTGSAKVGIWNQTRMQMQ